MTGMPRLLALMGSGETSPTMVKTHKELLARLGPPPVPAVVLDTPFGFQANADDLVARARNYFAESVGQQLDVASFRSATEVGSVEYESMLTRLRDARYVFAGPGSPTYALRQWEASQVPDVLRSKVRDGGCVTFASAAALTLGLVTLPVYEIYKAGEQPQWLPGLDLLSELGVRAAIIPHYDNAEGGTHDTRYCYLGEARLRRLEESLPDGAFVLGVDEHTGCILDIDEGTATVVGLGGVTIRRKGESTVLPSGECVPISSLASAVSGEGLPFRARSVPDAGMRAPKTEEVAGQSPLLAKVGECEGAFDRALDARDVHAGVQVMLDLEHEIHSWGADSLQSDELDRARAALRSMMVRLGELALTGARDPREVVGPFVEAMLFERTEAREAGRWDEADRLRDALSALGIELRDSPKGTEWSLD